jgi:hypothetical protein
MTLATHHPGLFGDLFLLFLDFLWSTPLRLRVEGSLHSGMSVVAA